MHEKYLIGYFRLELEKTIVMFDFTTFNLKIIKFGTKIALIRYFGLEFQKTNVVFEVNILEFVSMQRFVQKQKNFKLGTKNTLFRYFWVAI